MFSTSPFHRSPKISILSSRNHIISSWLKSFQKFIPSRSFKCLKMQLERGRIPRSYYDQDFMLHWTIASKHAVMLVWGTKIQLMRMQLWEASYDEVIRKRRREWPCPHYLQIFIVNFTYKLWSRGVLVAVWLKRTDVRTQRHWKPAPAPASPHAFTWHVQCEFHDVLLRQGDCRGMIPCQPPSTLNLPLWSV